MNITTIGAVLVMVCMAIGADNLLKEAGLQKSMFNIFFFGGMGLYSLTAFVWYYVLRNAKLAEANLMYALLTILVSVITGILFFKERLSAGEIFAFMTAVASIVMLSRFV